MEGSSGWCSRRVCVVSLGGESNRLHGVVCWVAVLRGGARCREIATLMLPSISFVIPDVNVMLSIVDRMVDARCVATTGGRRLFCILYNVHLVLYILILD
jgi:hypothetical protein